MARRKKVPSLINNSKTLPDEKAGTDCDADFEIQKINQNRKVITNIIGKMIDKINQPPDIKSKSRL